jgi:hypothetical protein
MATLRNLTLTSWYQAATVIFMTLVSLLLSPTRSLAVLTGGTIMVLNFLALRFFAARALLGAKPKLAAAMALIAKLFIVAGLMAFCILVMKLDVLGFAVGMSSLFVGVFLAMIHQAFSPAAVSASSGSAP